MMTPDVRFRAIVKEYIDPVMKENSFKKSGQKYVLNTDVFSFRFDIQRSRYNTKDDLRFTINMDIYLHENIISKFPFVFLAPVLANRVAKLAGTVDYWGCLNIQDDNPAEKDREIGEKFKDILVNHAIPFMGTLRSLQDVISVLERQDHLYWTTPLPGEQVKEWRATLYYALGDKEKSLDIVDQAINETRFEGYKKNLEEFKSQILSSLPPAACFLLGLHSAFSSFFWSI